MIEQGQTWANDAQKFEVIGFSPSGHALVFGLTKVDYLNLDDQGEPEIPVDVLEDFLQKEMNDFKLMAKS
jgi:hypothetical protein